MPRIKIGDGETPVATLEFADNNDSLAPVATSGKYDDLTDKPTIPTTPGEVGAMPTDAKVVKYEAQTLEDIDKTQARANIDAISPAEVDSKIAAFVDSAPETLDTLNELAAALGDDPNFATTVTTELGKKANSADLALVATTGKYTDLSDKPTISYKVDENGVSRVELKSTGIETEKQYLHTITFNLANQYDKLDSHIIVMRLVNDNPTAIVGDWNSGSTSNVFVGAYIQGLENPVAADAWNVIADCYTLELADGTEIHTLNNFVDTVTEYTEPLYIHRLMATTDVIQCYEPSTHFHVEGVPVGITIVNNRSTPYEYNEASLVGAYIQTIQPIHDYYPPLFYITSEMSKHEQFWAEWSVYGLEVSLNSQSPWKDAVTKLGRTHVIKRIATDDGEAQIDYNALANLPTIPSKTSELTNDSDFVIAPIEDGLGLYSIQQKGCAAGCLGYYIEAIDTTNKKIYLSDITTQDANKIPTSGTDDKTNSSFATPSYATGDEFTMWVFDTTSGRISIIGNITSITNNVVSYNTETTFTPNTASKPSKIYDWSFFVQSKPRVGLVPLTNYSFAAGFKTEATASYAVAEGYETKALARQSRAEGYKTVASDLGAHAEGRETTANGYYAHSEGYLTLSSGTSAHAEGHRTQATNYYAHSEGLDTIASGQIAHAEGNGTIASGGNSHAEGEGTLASERGAHAGGLYTKATAEAQTAIGKYNKENANALFIVGNGTGEADTQRSNAFEVIDINGTPSIKIGNATLSEKDLTDGLTYTLTEKDKADIATLVLGMLPIAEEVSV